VRKLTPSQKGAAAEAAFAAHVIQLGFRVLRPLCEGGRYDLMIDLEPELVRVQCKWASRAKGVLRINLNGSRLTPGGYVRSTYSAGEVDAIGAWSPDQNRCYLIPIAEVAGGREVSLRVRPTRNNQAEGVRWASTYDLADMLLLRRSQLQFAPIAQLAAVH
jgi:PD-(D/E)XK nuclease superfamily protein